MRKARRGFQRCHHVNRHEPVIMFARIGIIAPQGCLRFAGQGTGRLDPHILDQRFCVLFQIAINAHATAPDMPPRHGGKPNIFSH